MTELERRLLEAGDALLDAAQTYITAKALSHKETGQAERYVDARNAWRAIAREVKESSDDA